MKHQLSWIFFYTEVALTQYQISRKYEDIQNIVLIIKNFVLHKRLLEITADITLICKGLSDKSRSSFQDEVLRDLENPVEMRQDTCAAVISALWHAMGRTAEGMWEMT